MAGYAVDFTLLGNLAHHWTGGHKRYQRTSKAPNTGRLGDGPEEEATDVCKAPASDTLSLGGLVIAEKSVG